MCRWSWKNKQNFSNWTSECLRCCWFHLTDVVHVYVNYNFYINSLFQWIILSNWKVKSSNWNLAENSPIAICVEMIVHNVLINLYIYRILFMITIYWIVVKLRISTYRIRMSPLSLCKYHQRGMGYHCIHWYQYNHRRQWDHRLNIQWCKCM